MNKNEQPKYTRFVPTLAFDAIFKSDYKRKDDLYCILHTIYCKQNNYRNKFDQYHTYIEIPQVTLMKTFSDKTNLSNGLKYLKENEIIDCIESYSNGGEHKTFALFSKKYRINQSYLGKHVEVEMQDKNINKKIMEMQIENRIFNERRLMFSKTNYYKNFKIDYNGAYEFLVKSAIGKLKVLGLNHNIFLSDIDLRDIVECKNDFIKNRIKFIGIRKQFNDVINVFMSSHNKILSIKNDYLYFNRNKTNGRLDTNLTTLPTELRQFLKGNEVLYSIDIKNSQPFFFYCLLKQEGTSVDGAELEKYGDWVRNGLMYEFLAKEWELEFGQVRERKFFKGLTFKIFFSNLKSYQKEKMFFRNLFPTIMNFIDDTNRESNKILANKLTTIESTAIISIILPELGKKGIKPFTIHDSFVCNESEVEAILKTFNERIIEMYGIAPQLHIKTLIDDSNGHTEYESDVSEPVFIMKDGKRFELNEEYLQSLSDEEFLTLDYVDCNDNIIGM